MKASTLLMKLIATDDSPFDEKTRQENSKVLRTYAEMLHIGTKDFAAIKYIANALNYIHGFNKNGFIEQDLESEHAQAAKALADASQRSPWRTTPEEYTAIIVMLDYWDAVLEQASAKLVREIQHEMDFVCPEAKMVRKAETSRVSKRSHRKPKKKK